MDFFIDSYPAALPHIKSGNVKAIAIAGPNRNPQTPDVPTIAEAGVKGYESDAWYAILTPAGTPQAVVAQLNKSIAQALRGPDVQEKLGGLGMQAVGNSSQDAAKFIAAEAAKWSKVARAANIRAD